MIFQHNLKYLQIKITHLQKLPYILISSLLPKPQYQKELEGEFVNHLGYDLKSLLKSKGSCFVESYFYKQVKKN